MITVFVFLFSGMGFADEHEKEGKEEHHEEERELPAGITTYNDESGEFSLSDEALKNFGIQTQKLVKDGADFKVPSHAIVRSLKKTSLYVLQNKKFKLLEVEIIKNDSVFSWVRVKQTISASLLVTSGINFLKTIQLSLEEDPSEGHGH